MFYVIDVNEAMKKEKCIYSVQTFNNKNIIFGLSSYVLAVIFILIFYIAFVLIATLKDAFNVERDTLIKKIFSIQEKIRMS